jgi:hypothetical protein
MSRRVTWIAAAGIGVAGLLAVTATTAASAAAGGPAAASRWRIVESVKTDVSGEFTAIAATGKTTAWAFDGTGNPSPPRAYQLSGGRWRRAPFIGVLDEQVIAAGATSPSDVWAFTQGFGPAKSRVLHWNGVKWSVVKTFADEIGDAAVLAANDIWVFGEAAFPMQPALGVWHYNGHSWTQVSKNLQGGSALSATDVWGFSGVNVEHWTRGKWVATSVKKLLPPTIPGPLNDPQVTGILAYSDSNVYALGNGVAEDEGGPIVVLHYNGRTWAKMAEGEYGFGPSPQISTDGTGGLWLPMQGPVTGLSYLLHYAAGKLTPAALPVGARGITIDSVARIPGTTEQLAGGSTHGTAGTNVVGVVLQYS